MNNKKEAIERLNLYGVLDNNNTEERRKINEIIAVVNELETKVEALRKAKSEVRDERNNG